MTRVTFHSPGQMIASGFGLLVLGIALLAVGIGFFGALIGIYWIGKGIHWQYQLSSSQRSNRRQTQRAYRTVSGIQNKINNLKMAIEVKNYPLASELAADLSYDPNIKAQVQQEFIRDAAVYAAFSGDFELAEEYNNDERFNNRYDPDYHNVYSIIRMGQGNVAEAKQMLDSVYSLEAARSQGRYHNAARQLVSTSPSY